MASLHAPEGKIVQINEERCPVSDSVLGQLYRASPHGLASMIEAISPQVRAMLSVYCYRRSHLATIGLAIAASCNEYDLATHGGNLGADLFTKSRADDAKQSLNSQRRQVTLSSGPIRQMAPLEDVLI